MLVSDMSKRSYRCWSIFLCTCISFERRKSLNWALCIELCIHKSLNWNTNYSMVIESKRWPKKGRSDQHQTSVGIIFYWQKPSYIHINRLHHAKSERISGFFFLRRDVWIVLMYFRCFPLLFLACDTVTTNIEECNSWPKFRQFVDLLFSVCVYRKPFELPMQNIYALLKR